MKESKKCGVPMCNEVATYKCEDRDVDGKIWYRCKIHKCQHCILIKKGK